MRDFEKKSAFWKVNQSPQLQEFLKVFIAYKNSGFITSRPY